MVFKDEPVQVKLPPEVVKVYDHIKVPGRKQPERKHVFKCFFFHVLHHVLGQKTLCLPLLALFTDVCVFW